MVARAGDLPRIRTLESVLGTNKPETLLCDLEFTYYREPGGDGTRKPISELDPRRNVILIGMYNFDAPTWEEVKAERERKRCLVSDSCARVP